MHQSEIIHQRNLRRLKELKEIVFDVPRIKFHSKRVKVNKFDLFIRQVKRACLIGTSLIVILGIYTKFSYDMINKMQAEAASPMVSPLASPTPKPTPKPTPVVVAVADDRVNRLTTYLKKKHSPLADYAALIVREADEHDIGWTKIVAISAIESTYGTNLSGNYNAWNIMAFIGNKRIGPQNFESWEQGIKEVSSLLDRAYRQNEVKAVQMKYCPSYECSTNWVPMVLSTTDEILDIK